MYPMQFPAANYSADGVPLINGVAALQAALGEPGTPPKMEPSVGCPFGTMPHVVVQGDTLYALAKRYGTTVDELRRLNPAVVGDMLYIGQLLCVPVQGMACDGVMVTIQEGDTLYAIANRYGVSMEEILKRNPHISMSYYQAGTVICVPAQPPVVPAPPPASPVPMPPPIVPLPTPVSPMPPCAPCPPSAACPACPPCPPAVPCPPCESVVPSGCMRITVGKDDTLTSIVKAHCTSVFMLMVLNPMLDPAQITAGMQLVVCPMPCEPPCPRDRRVVIKDGMDLESVARAMRVSTNALLMANPYLAPCAFCPGQVVCVPK